MDNPRPEKVAVVDEVREQLSASGAVLLTEYRGINVAEMAKLRRALRDAGGTYKIYKNTLVRFAARDLGMEIDDLLTGPTGIAFVDGDAVTVAKALRDFAKGNPNLVVKGGVLGETLLSADEAKALADVAPREELLARLAGALAAPMVQFAGLLEAIPRNFAYGLKALIDLQGGVPESAAAEEEPTADDAEAAPAEAAPTDEAPAAEAPAEAVADEATADEAPAESAATDEAASTDQAPAPDAGTETPDEHAAPAADEPAAEAAETPTEEN